MKIGSKVTVQIGRATFENGVVDKVLRSGKIKVVFADNTYDNFDPKKVKPALAKKAVKGIADAALARAAAKAGVNPKTGKKILATAQSEKDRNAKAERVMYGDSGKGMGSMTEIAAAIRDAALGKRAVSERGFEKLKAITDMTREERKAMKAIMSAAESRVSERSVSNRTLQTENHLMHINPKRLLFVLEKLADSLCYIQACQFRSIKTKARVAGSPLTAEEIATLKRIATAKADKKGERIVFLNGMNDMTLLHALRYATI